MVQRLALLGDSILDNKPYVAPEPDTATHLQRSLVHSWIVDLLARDGSEMPDIRFQMDDLPAVPDLAILSIGGNDAINHIGLLEHRATTTTISSINCRVSQRPSAPGIARFSRVCCLGSIASLSVRSTSRPSPMLEPLASQGSH